MWFTCSWPSEAGFSVGLGAQFQVRLELGYVVTMKELEEMLTS